MEWKKNMKKLDRLMKEWKKAYSADLRKPPKRLSSKYTHYITKMTKAEQDVLTIEKINKNAPIKRTKLKE